ncbi:MAG: ABC transporter ATP-binding protein, partial [Candidatus Lambdaproteobacteria bacterium]|nr:ABC transporter ATP-binding protein [Candidatus Lambdaproteobacteria bacterium]
PLLREGGRNGRRPRLLWRYPRERFQADRQTVLDLLRAVQIPDPEDALRKYPHQFSGGQRQRLMIAMALLPRPELIIADEPTTALDVTIQAQILRLLRQLVKERNISVLFTTHDLGTAHEICDRIMVMYAGQEMEFAPTRNFFHRPFHPYTKRLLESLPNPQGNIQDIAGELPELIDPPQGCRFHPRCDFATDICRRTRPDISAVEPGHWLRCYHPIAAPAQGESAATTTTAAPRNP